jgi:hypothetical protein
MMRNMVMQKAYHANGRNLMLQTTWPPVKKKLQNASQAQPTFQYNTCAVSGKGSLEMGSSTRHRMYSLVGAERAGSKGIYLHRLYP